MHSVNISWTGWRHSTLPSLHSYLSALCQLDYKYGALICMSVTWCVCIKVFQGGWIEMFSFYCLYPSVCCLASSCMFHIKMNLMSIAESSLNQFPMIHWTRLLVPNSEGLHHQWSRWITVLGCLLAFCLGCQFVSADKLWQRHQPFLLTRSHPWVYYQYLYKHCKPD